MSTDELRDLVAATLRTHAEVIGTQPNLRAPLSVILTLAEHYPDVVADFVLGALDVAGGERSGPGPVFRLHGIERSLARRTGGPDDR